MKRSVLPHDSFAHVLHLDKMRSTLRYASIPLSSLSNVSTMADSPKPDEEPPLLLFVKFTSGIMMALVFWLFIAARDPSNKEAPLDTTPLSAACFGIAALVALMPWQLAPFFRAKNLTAYHKLLTSGAQMSLGSLYFLCATILKYTFLNSESLLASFSIVSAAKHFDEVMEFFAAVFFLLGVFHAGIGFNRFSDQMMRYLYRGDHPDKSSHHNH